MSRYSHQNGFNNPSTLCKGLFEFYSDVAAYMLNHGFKEKDLLSNLGIEVDQKFQS